MTSPGRVPYAALHAHPAFSFLDGPNQPEELVAEAARPRLAPPAAPTSTTSTTRCSGSSWIASSSPAHA